MRPLEFGWYLPTHGDTTAYGLMEAQVAGSPELCERVVKAAEDAAFDYGSPARSWRRPAGQDDLHLRADIRPPTARLLSPA
jgi:hypothetical protein